MKTAKYGPLLFLIAGLLSIAGCNRNKDITGNTSETGNALVSGKLYNKDGTPAANAAIHIHKKAILTDTSMIIAQKVLADAFATITDNAGGFAINKIEPGLYVLEGAKDSALVLIDSVSVKGAGSPVVLQADTLRPAGAVKGIVYLSEGGDARKVFVLAVQVDRFASVNLDGSFKFSNLAQGKYDLRLISGLDNYGVLDTLNIPVLSGVTTNMDTIRLPFIGIPTPKNLSIAYDTLKQIVALAWGKMDTSLVSGYNIYRRHVDSGFVRLNAAPVVDVVYADSTVFQDQSYIYQIKALDKKENEGLFSQGIQIQTVSAFPFVDSMTLGIPYPMNFYIGKDKNFYVTNFGDSAVSVFDSNGILSQRLTTAQFCKPNDIVLDSRGNVYFSDPDNHRIIKLTANGDKFFEWSLLRPLRLAIDSSDNIYVVFRDSCIAKFDTNGMVLDSVVLPGADLMNIQISNSGNLLVGDGNLVAIREYTPELALVRIYSVPVQLPSLLLLDVDANGFIYLDKGRLVGQASMSGIAIYNQNSEFVGKFGLFSRLIDAQVVGHELFIICYADNPWRPQIQKFSLPF